MSAERNGKDRALGRSGIRVGPLSYGGAPLGNLGFETDPVEGRASLEAAWECGVRYFDVAPHYGLGLAERRMGEMLRSRPRDEFVISTKVGRVLVPRANPAGALDPEEYAVPADSVRVRDYSRDGVLRSIEDSLDRLGLDRVDVVYVHDPDDYYVEAVEGAFPALDELRSQGVIAAYGAGMNQSEMLVDFVRNTDLDVVLVAGRYSLLDQGALTELLPEAEARHVSVVVGGVFNSGLLSQARPFEGLTYDYRPASTEILARARQLADICARHGVPLPAAAIQFPLGHPAVSTLCVGVRSAEQFESDAELLEFPIPAELWHELAEAGFISADASLPKRRETAS